MNFGLRTAVKFAVKLTMGTVWLPIALARRQQGVRILCYHKVNDTAGNKLSVSPAMFRRQLEYLARRHTVLSLSAAADALKSGRPLPPQAVVITFDDGYRDAWLNAVPALLERGFHATFFITTGRVGAKHFEHDAGFEQFDNTVMTWNEIRELIKTGLAVGSHTITHPILAGLDPGDQHTEIVHSREILERELGTTIDTFSYPSGGGGDFDASAVALVASAGYRCACTTIDGVNDGRVDPFRLRRSNVLNEDGMFLFRYTMMGALDWLSVKNSAAGRAGQMWFRRVFGY